MKFRGVHACAAMAAAMLSAVPALADPTPTHAYTLNNTLADLNGGPSLSLTGPAGAASLGATGVTFLSGQGLSLASSAFASTDTYSIAMDFSFTSWSVDGYNRVINSNAGDAGLYVEGTTVPPSLNYYEGADHTGGAFDLDTMHHLLFTRDDSGISIYIDGSDVLNTSAFVSSLLGGNPVLFFLDNTVESGGGYVDSICTYDSKLSATDAAAIGGGSCAGPANNPLNSTGSVPEPVSWLSMVGGFGIMGSALRRRRTTQFARS